MSGLTSPMLRHSVTQTLGHKGEDLCGQGKSLAKSSELDAHEREEQGCILALTSWGSCGVPEG